MKKKNSIKRAQSQAGLSFAERKNFRPMAKFFTMLVLLMTAVTGAWAQEQSETIATTAQIVEGTHFTIDNHGKIANESGMNADGGITVTAKSGETITKVVISCTYMAYVVNGGNTSVSSGTKEFTGDGENITVITVTGVNAFTFTFTCSNPGPQFVQFVVYFTPTDVTGLTLSQTEAAMTVGGDALTLTATVAPANATYKTVTWTTSNASVATVANGVVTAVGEGTATITATATNGTAATSDDKTATCTVTVAEPIELTFNDDKTEASFDMPANDVTVDYELVRDMASNMPVTVGDGTDGYRIRLKKEGTSFVPAEMTPQQMAGLIAVTDGIESKTLTNMTDYTISIYAVNDEDKPTGEAITFQSLTPGRYVAIATAVDGTIYDGETEPSNIFVLFQGYEVEVAAKSFATYYKDEALTVDEASTDATLYTISNVTDAEAVLSSKLETAPANTPLLVYNSSAEAKTILLIPTNKPELALTVAPEFKGTLAAKTFTAADLAAKDHYVLTANNQFVWVKDAGTIGANKCWLEITKGAPQNARAIVFGETTGVKEVKEVKEVIEVKDDSFYDLNGRKVATPTRKGIYILNGRKVVVK